MKYSKLLKSAILSAALLYSGGALAQQTGDTKLTIVNPALTITASELNFGSFRRSAGTSAVTLSCNSGGSPTTTSVPDVKVTDGTCGKVTVSTGSQGPVTFRASVTATTLTSTGATALVAPTIRVSNDAGAVVSAQADRTVQASTDNIMYIGGVVNLGANQAAGEYSGTYTFTAAIQ